MAANIVHYRSGQHRPLYVRSTSATAGQVIIVHCRSGQHRPLYVRSTSSTVCQVNIVHCRSGQHRPLQGRSTSSTVYQVNIVHCRSGQVNIGHCRAGQHRPLYIRSTSSTARQVSPGSRLLNFYSRFLLKVSIKDWNNVSPWEKNHTSTIVISFVLLVWCYWVNCKNGATTDNQGAGVMYMTKNVGWLCVCYLTWHDYPSLAEGESRGIWVLLLLLLMLLIRNDSWIFFEPDYLLLFLLNVSLW